MRTTGGQIEVGRRSRVVGTALARALHVRDGGRCRFPGCGSRITDAHHIEHWANGGLTVLRNLISLCRYHHTLVHEGGFRVEAGRFYRPDGRELHAAPAVAGEPVRLDERAIAADRSRLQSTWDGRRIEYDTITAWWTAHGV